MPLFIAFADSKKFLGAIFEVLEIIDQVCSAFVRYSRTDVVTNPHIETGFYEFCSAMPNICRTETAISQTILTGLNPTKSADVQMNLVPPKSPSKAFL